MGAFNLGKLDALSNTMLGYVDSGAVAGLVFAVERHGEWHSEAIGLQDLRSRQPMVNDSIFRIASMTKAVTAVAALMLVEEGVLALDAPVNRWLPELSSMRVLRSRDAELTDTVPASRALTLRDLLAFTMGFGFVIAPPGTYPIQQAIVDAGLQPSADPPPFTPDAWITKLASLPLISQPGEQWMYHTGSDVAGVLVARASGIALGDFFEQRIFAPLGMKDSGFFVPPESAGKMGRFTTAYSPLPGGGLEIRDDPRWGLWSTAPTFPSGGSGLVSTAADYLAFGKMLLAGGQYPGGRLLQQASVTEMLRDQLTPAQKAASPFTPGFWDVHGWGLGLSVVTARDAFGRAPGTFGWNGGLGTSSYCDPSEGLVGVLLTQTAFTSAVPPPVVMDFWAGVYAALAVS